MFYFLVVVFCDFTEHKESSFNNLSNVIASEHNNEKVA